MIKVQTPSEFSRYIEERVTNEGVGYIEAIVDHCAKNEIEIETASKLITPILKSKIQGEASDLNLLKVSFNKLF